MREGNRTILWIGLAAIVGLGLAIGAGSSIIAEETSDEGYVGSLSSDLEAYAEENAAYFDMGIDEAAANIFDTSGMMTSAPKEELDPAQATATSIDENTVKVTCGWLTAFLVCNEARAGEDVADYAVCVDGCARPTGAETDPKLECDEEGNQTVVFSDGTRIAVE